MPANLSSDQNSPSSKVQKHAPFIQNLSFFLLLLLLPGQLGLHFWPSWSFVQGLRIDYLSPTLYFSYLLVGLLVLTRTKFYSTKIVKARLRTLPIYFLLLTAVILANHSPASLLKVDQLLLLVLLGITIVKTYRKLTWGFIGLSIALTYTSLLTILQFLYQRTIGLWLIGERALSLSTPGVARLDFLGVELFRPYASFSHPNSLAGFLLVGIFLATALKDHIPQGLFRTSLLLSATSLILTGSRAAILTGAFLSLLLLIKKFFSVKKIVLFSLLVISIVTFLAFNASLPNDQSFTRRAEELRFGLSTLDKHPYTGIGLNNFIPAIGETLPSKLFPTLSSPVLWLQPVHNVFVLILVETGFVGFSVLVYFLGKTLLIVNHKSFFLYLAFVGVLFTSLADHYWFTLIQNQLLATVVLGLIWSNKTRD